MREIKFRGKRVDNGEWVYGYYAEDINYTMDGSEYIDCIINTTKGTSEGMWFEVIPGSVGQFTGLYDKNGKEIYEGDILKASIGWIYAVEWDDENGRFLGFTPVERKIVYVGREPKSEVIGNIFENPSLLEVQP